MAATLDEHGRPGPPLDGDEWATLSGFLDHQRATFAWKSADLTAVQMSRRLPPSSMTLAGLMKHLAYVEDDWFGRWLNDEPRREPWASVDWAATPDWEWDSARTDEPEVLRALWEQSVARARTAAAEAFHAGGLSGTTRRRWPDGRSPSLRWVMTHMVEEYARHNGHADLLREAVDGRVGE
ncbi:DinB family protein [Cellulomonas shaoxiangyii]|uniref:DinB family protein n=1 Tax=Cellulomonas shaoxiangyii TaxID=2566013 RepID=A0A4P7SLC1_9CELL|nr:DinB family protein [Cellulomonas shaoxiangyii]QCB94721.1 DinB family protein [Cellulomonas shaoxiangyii]TGY86451.1 DinB family protein [Cellulomonas shaoxiangyii]